jgi:hypothetical protein
VGKEQSFETPKIVLKVSRRLRLAELAATYKAEKATPQKRGQPSAREKFINILFPHTIKDKSEKANKRKKGKKVSNQIGERLSEQEVREKTESTFDYWIRLGKRYRDLSVTAPPP